jgi:hypothetical protein
MQTWIVEKSPQVRTVHKLHGKEERVILCRFQIPAIHHIVVAQLPQRSHFTPEPAGKSLILAQLGGEKLQRARLLHEDVLGKVNSPHPALSQLADDAVCLVDQHPRFEITDFIQKNAMGGTGGVAIGIAGVALWALFHAFVLLFQKISWRIHSSTQCRRAQWRMIY